MDAKQLSETGKQIVKAVEGGDSAATILQLLQPLQKWSATEDALRQSKIGVAVNKLRQNKDSKVAELSTRLINKWKADVNANKRKGTAPSSPALGAVKANGTNGVSSGKSSPAPQAQVKRESRKSTVEPEKRNSKTDSISTELTGSAIRDKCMQLIYDGLAFMSEEGRICLNNSNYTTNDWQDRMRFLKLLATSSSQPSTHTSQIPRKNTKPRCDHYS